MRANRLAVSLIGVSFRYPQSGRDIFRNIQLEVREGEVLAVLGPSGAGKSTLLKIIAGLEAPTGGQVKRECHSRGGFVFQAPVLLEWLDVKKNIAFPKGAHTRAENEQLGDLLDAVKLSDSVHLHPRQLSGGMKARVQLARALYNSPEILYLDEAFSALDEGLRLEMNELFRDLQKKFGFTALLISHSLEEAAYLANRALVLKVSGCNPTEVSEISNTRSPASLETAGLVNQLRGALGLVRE